MPAKSMQAFAMTKGRSEEHAGIHNDKKEKSREDMLEVVEKRFGWSE